MTPTKNASKRAGIGHANALAEQAWVKKYWDWRHAGLVDLTEQLGTPDACYTYAPYEHIFAYHDWIRHAMDALGREGPRLPAQETTHLVHSMRQLVFGNLAGANGQKPMARRGHAFSNAQSPSQKTVLMIWMRIEIQEGSRANT